MNGHIHVTAIDFKPGTAASGKVCRDGACPPHEQEDEANQSAAGIDCSGNRLLCQLGEKGNKEPGRHKRIRVEANRESGDTCSKSTPDKWKYKWNSGELTHDLSDSSPTSYQGTKKEAVGIRFNPQHTSRGKGKKGRKNISKQRKQATTALAKRFSAELIDQATDAEIKFKAFLDKYGFKYVFQRPFKHFGGFSIVDFYLNGFATVVEIDGGYHQTEAQQILDERRTHKLKKINQMRSVVRFTNEEVFTMPEKEILKRLCFGILPQTIWIL